MAGGPVFSDAERAALALAESVTRISDRQRSDAVPDDVWEDAAAHHDERGSPRCCCGSPPPTA
jgi:alkylhydroperoxidase family enzyme